MSTDLANGIQNSANALITSEANYDGVSDSLHAALASLPAKLSDIRSLLMDYRTIVGNVPAGNSFRQSADELYDVINGIYTDANSQVSAAMEVCVIIESNFVLHRNVVCSQYLQQLMLLYLMVQPG